MSTEAELLVALEQVTAVTPDKWRRLAALPLYLQRLALAEYAGQDWSDPATPVGARVLAIIEALGSVGSAVGNVAGAISGAKAAV